ncbi:6-phosphofructokinase [Phytoactinopolyspora endophytica]|uniref:6-phosphofructokinase n=1 Tax=Phytoactinopolyspora endophytica TaxID=1642495 RepID=UPI00101C9B38|nr:6-phosphofructokinase [Phytoactinopolyspora endophytica]
MRVLLGQTGAPTAVVNRSVAGFLRGAGPHEVMVARGGPDALVAGRFEKLADVGFPPGVERDGGSWLGGGRRATSPADVDAIVTELERHCVDGIGLIGGNGTMALLAAVAGRARERAVGLRVVGIPKTIDNDLLGVDHAPGFASAARYLTTVLPDMARDHRAMTSVEPVRIVETMGRAAGWLALAATLPRDPEHPVHRVFTPEQAFDRDGFLRDVRALVGRHGRALVVVSEGYAPELTDAPVHATNHTTLITGGVARELAAMVASELALPARGEVLGVAQRCASALASGVDAVEAELVGYEAARLLIGSGSRVCGGGPDGAVMVGIERVPGAEYAVTYPLVPLNDVIGLTRTVPDRWRTSEPLDLRSFHDWLTPLVCPVEPVAHTLTVPTEER